MYQICLSRDDAAQTGHTLMGSFSLVSDTCFTCNFLKKMQVKNHTVWTMGSVSGDIIWRLWDFGYDDMMYACIEPNQSWDSLQSCFGLATSNMNIRRHVLWMHVHAHTCKHHTYRRMVPLTYNIHIWAYYNILPWHFPLKPCSDLHHGVSPQSGKSVTMAWETVEKCLVPKSNPGQVRVIQEGRTGKHFKQGNLVEGIKQCNVWCIVGMPFQTGNNV